MNNVQADRLDRAKQYLKERGISQPRIQFGVGVPFTPKYYPMTNLMYALQGLWLTKR